MSDGPDDALMHAVAESMRDAAATAIMPRFQALADADIAVKGADDVVTAADLEAEAMLSEGLARIRPGLGVLGEEASHADPGLRPRLERGGAYWVVDPLDGTKEFVAGRPGFGIMVALVESGQTTAAWIYLPVSDRLYDGAAGIPVRCNGQPMTAARAGSRTGAEGVVGFALTRFAPPDVRELIDARATAFHPAAAESYASAAHAYANLLEGRLDFGLYWRTEPWDHLAGAFLTTSSGGRCARLDGTAYGPGDHGAGLLVTSSGAAWPAVRELFYPASAGESLTP